MTDLGHVSTGHGATTEADTRGGRVYGLGDRGAVSHEQTTADVNTATPERWRPNEVRPVAAVVSTTPLTLSGARIDARRNGGGTVTVDNRHGRGDTPGLPGFDH